MEEITNILSYVILYFDDQTDIKHDLCNNRRNTNIKGVDQ